MLSPVEELRSFHPTLLLEPIVPVRATALETLQAIYQNPEIPLHTRLRAAAIALPFESPKLIAAALFDGKDFASMLDRAVARSRKVQVIEARPEEPKPIEVEEPRPKTSVKPRFLPVPDRRFRRI
jgi:hypothetical protein